MLANMKLVNWNRVNKNLYLPKNGFKYCAIQTRSLSAASAEWRKNLSSQDNDYLTGRRPDSWYTGLKPDSLNNRTLRSTKQPILENVTKEAMATYFNNTWLTSEILFSSLQGEEAFYRPPYHNLRHPLIFYYGHPVTFYINKLRVAKLLDKGVDPYLEEICEVGVDEMRWDDISTESKDWPAVGHILDYRKKVHGIVMDLIDHKFKTPQQITWDDPLWSLMMAIEHEKIHIETSSVLIRELPEDLLLEPELFPTIPPVKNSKITNDFLKIKEKVVKLGKDISTPTYGWDNEYGSRHVKVPDFEVSQFKITNEQYHEFVSSGGYVDRQFWSEDGWGWRRFRNQKWPFFWKQDGPAGSHIYKLRNIFSTGEMRWNVPVAVNYHEAQAYANWLYAKEGSVGPKYRILTEAEHVALRDQKLVESPLRNDPTLLHGGDNDVNLNLRYGGESDVDMFAPAESGAYDLHGNVSEWLEDDMNPLRPDVHPYYDDFTMPCYDGEHKMIMGGSFMSSGDAGANSFSRFHFRPHFLQHSGFRVVKPSLAEPNVKGENVATFLGKRAMYSAPDHTADTNSNRYETNELMSQYFSLHFGQSGELLKHTVRNEGKGIEQFLEFPQRVTKKLLGYFAADTSDIKVLDVGCSVGGSSFEAAKDSRVSKVVGFDFSASFIKASQQLQQGETLSFSVTVSGDSKGEVLSVSPPSAEVADKCHFQVHDATKLDTLQQGKFDAVLASNLLCRLPEPLKFLKSLPDVVEDKGVVLFASPFSWLEEFTPKQNWLSMDDFLKQMDTLGFELVDQEDIPLLIREHERKYQLIMSQGTVFRKR